MNQLRRLKIIIQGAVQGVGFRPFIYRLATELNLKGWVNNSASGVFIEVEGTKKNLEIFLTRIPQEKPSISSINTVETTWLDPVNYTTFEIRHSSSGEKTAVVLPDLSTCSDCLQEIFDPNNRRYLYPFTNCTNCGPRYTIIEELPYDRPHTTMKVFMMCECCQEEYENPLDRRFHAQPNACPVCGPRLQLWNKKGDTLANDNNALNLSINALKDGKILALKGLGGFQLVVDGRHTEAVTQLRQRKHRPHKPFALMYASLEAIKNDCEVNGLEETILTSPQAPIVLLKRKKSQSLSPEIAPNNPYLGVMLPSTPLHHLLLYKLDFPIVATSGNLASEPICIDEQEALQRLENIADLFLVHNRPILRPVDDSVVRVMGEKEMVIRRARGYAPFPIQINDNLLRNNKKKDQSIPNILAVGGHLKNTVAIIKNNQVFISQHIGDLSTPEALKSFNQVMESLKTLYDFDPEIIVCDAHPDYVSSQYAKAQNLPLITVQHHHAHILSCLGDNNLNLPILGVAWDGTGYGNDQTIWGGEFLLVTGNQYERVAYFRPFKLPGGEQAVKDPRRIALSLLSEVSQELYYKELPFLETISTKELNLVKQMLSRNLNTPLTSSVGRLFDGVAAMIGICQNVTFEGQGAMALEYAINDLETDASYPYEIEDSLYPLVIDWELMIHSIIEDILGKISHQKIAAKFHNTLVDIIINIAQRSQEKNIILTGGCFQNKYLTERAILGLTQEKFTPFWHHNVPPNDGGLALGQIVAGIHRKK
ncbi:hydrogenase maturation protein [Crocosphaera subtropica ATCC 51142]|uniref:Carbamoyltransferase n=1 Tax=Crocosphaera subtropica (strain ATCC 51142 / BH68) TaxID=43989 RepID=B1WZA0_CROS5|nr:carbamoyltransferase HypF [Crocosphaera subtropica]ACB49466.1 hydrogenase maturation protein [Crocosphaera subtropica ATCC 51142]